MLRLTTWRIYLNHHVKIKKMRKDKLLEKLQSEPFAKERQEFGKMLMRHIDSFTPDERKRYNELNQILLDYEKSKLDNEQD